MAITPIAFDIRTGSGSSSPSSANASATCPYKASIIATSPASPRAINVRRPCSDGSRLHLPLRCRQPLTFLVGALVDLQDDRLQRPQQTRPRQLLHPPRDLIIDLGRGDRIQFRGGLRDLRGPSSDAPRRPPPAPTAEGAGAADSTRLRSSPGPPGSMSGTAAPNPPPRSPPPAGTRPDRSATSCSTSGPPSGWSTAECASAHAAASTSLRQPAILWSSCTDADRSANARRSPAPPPTHRRTCDRLYDIAVVLGRAGWVVSLM